MQLDRSRVAGAREPAERGWIAGILIESKPLVAVEDIKNLRAELEPHAFGQRKILLDRGVLV